MLFTDDERAALDRVPVTEIVALASDLDICAPAEIVREALLEQCVHAIVARAREEGLPFSKYDRDDISALPPPLLDSLGRLQGLRGRVTVNSIVKVGERVYRTYQKNRPDNPVALMLPMLLGAVARAALQPTGASKPT